MEHQLLETFYVESLGALYADLTVTARIQYPSGANWYPDWQLRCGDDDGNTVTNAHYPDENGTRRRYKIDVYRLAEWDDDDSRYPFGKAGTYPRRLQVLHNGNVVLTRMLSITIQPNMHVFTEVSGQRIDLVYTEETVISQNPLVKQMAIKKNSPANIALVQSNHYKGTVFVKTNVPVDLVSDDLTDNHKGDDYTSRWVQLQDHITLTRKIKTNEYQWRGEYDS